MQAAALVLIASALAQVAQCTATKLAGQIQDGSNEYNLTSFPYLAGVVFNSGGRTTCNGILIDDDWVLTTATCTTKGTITLYLATNNYSAFEPPSLRIDVDPSNIIRHSDFDSSVQKNDIALIKLPFTVSLKGPYIKTMRYNKNDKELYAGSVVNVTGYGATGVSGLPDLRFSNYAVLENDDCKKLADGAATALDTPTQGCIAVSGKGNGPCEEDDGAPVIARAGDGTQVMIGFFTPNKKVMCDDGLKFRVFTRTAAFDEWITSTMTKK